MVAQPRSICEIHAAAMASISIMKSATVQFRHFDQRHRGRGRRRNGREEPVSRLAIGCEIFSMSVRNTVNFTRLAAVHPRACSATARLPNTCSAWAPKSCLPTRLPSRSSAVWPDIKMILPALIRPPANSRAAYRVRAG